MPLPIAAQTESASKCGRIVEKACVDNKTTCIDGHAPANRLRTAVFATFALAQAQQHAHKIEVNWFSTHVPAMGSNTIMRDGVRVEVAGTMIKTTIKWRWMPHSRLIMHRCSLMVSNACLLLCSLAVGSTWCVLQAVQTLLHAINKNHNHTGGFVALETGGAG